jgi:hypothetical protein
MVTRDQFKVWARLCGGTTIRELRHIREVPRASMPACRPHRIVRVTSRLPLRELEETASAAHART